MKRHGQNPPKELQNGQIWRMEDSHLHIALVGKRLVHYKLYKAAAKRAPVSLLGKETLTKFLRENNGILVRE